MSGLGKPKLCTKFEVAIFSRCRNIKGEAPTFGELLVQGHTMMGLGKLQQHAKYEVAGFIYHGNIRDFVYKLIRFLSHPLGKLGVTYGIHL